MIEQLYLWHLKFRSVKHLKVMYKTYEDIHIKHQIGLILKEKLTEGW